MPVLPVVLVMVFPCGGVAEELKGVIDEKYDSQEEDGDGVGAGWEGAMSGAAAGRIEASVGRCSCVVDIREDNPRPLSSRVSVWWWIGEGWRRNGDGDDEEMRGMRESTKVCVGDDDEDIEDEAGECCREPVVPE